MDFFSSYTCDDLEGVYLCNCNHTVQNIDTGRGGEYDDDAEFLYILKDGKSHGGNGYSVYSDFIEADYSTVLGLSRSTGVSVGNLRRLSKNYYDASSFHMTPTSNKKVCLGQMSNSLSGSNTRFSINFNPSLQTLNYSYSQSYPDKVFWDKSFGTSLHKRTNINYTCTLVKTYPPNSPNSISKNEWGNGSGLIISTTGHIVTNYHVIENANEIEVEFILDKRVQNFNAEIIQSDKVNDLAIIKIVDANFDGLEELPYNFKTRSSDVGTKVYAYGYPMALSIMGKEIKVTDGIISSKSGYDGDIRTYQITAPIQAGNSGGPLFDEKGNFLGINSSGLRKDVADNVGYTIKSSYVINLIDVLPKTIDLPSSTKLQSLPLTEQVKEITKCVVLVKVK